MHVFLRTRPFHTLRGIKGLVSVQVVFEKHALLFKLIIRFLQSTCCTLDNIYYKMYIHNYGGCTTLIGVHEMHGQMYLIRVV